jgi:hypothetical protein
VPRIYQLKPGEADDPDANAILHEAVDGWWGDPGLFGLIAHRPRLLRAVVAVFREMFAGGTIEPYIKDMMRVRTGLEWQCAY